MRSQHALIVAAAMLVALTIDASAQLSPTKQRNLAEIEAELQKYERSLEQRANAPLQPQSVGTVSDDISTLRNQLDGADGQLRMLRNTDKALRGTIASTIENMIKDWADLPLPGGNQVPQPSEPDTLLADKPDPEPQPTLAPIIEERDDVEFNCEATPTAPGCNPTQRDIVTAGKKLEPRILTRPEARLHQEINSGKGEEIPVFSVLYALDQVKADGRAWLKVSPNSNGNPAGWMQSRFAVEWKSMLVMQYAPKGRRQPVLFYRNRDELAELVTDYEFDVLAQEDYTNVRAGKHNPNRIVAKEPDEAVNRSRQVYMMPILDFEEEQFDDGQDTVLLQLAGLNIESTTETASDDLTNFKVGVAFVIDTTASMGPYIERTKEFVKDTYRDLQREGLEDRFRFAVVGYRDNISTNSKIGYVTQTFRDFDAPTSGKDFMADIETLQPAKVSTQNWREDALAGLDDAIETLRWGDVDAKVILLVTDASARRKGDKLARNASLDIGAITQKADRLGIPLFVLHMQTPQAASVSERTEGYNDHRRAENQYSRMQRTGTEVDAKYFRVTGDTANVFGEALSFARVGFVGALKQHSQGNTVQPVFGDEELGLMAPDVNEETGTVLRKSNGQIFSMSMANEMFRFQQEYLGTRRGTKAPAFYRAWAADRDLLNPAMPSFEVSVLMTRADMSDLKDRLDEVYKRASKKDVGLGEFFETVRDDSGRTVTDPKVRDFLPEVLQDLPYCSKFLCMDRDAWESMSENAQVELLEEVAQKIITFTDISRSSNGWQNLGGRATADEFYPLPLRDLP